MEAEASDNATSLLTAASNGHLEIVKYLHENGAKLEIRTTDGGGYSPVIVAAQNGHLEVLKFLLEKGAPKNETTDKNTTALFLASKYGHYDIVWFLLSSDQFGKCDIDKVSKTNCECCNGHTALSIAEKRGHDEIAIVLRTY